MEFGKNTDTPDQFINKTIVKKENYAKDSLTISSELRKLLLQHKEFFNSNEYFEGTKIIIDTIVYSPDLNKLVILVLTKNPTSRQLLPTKGKDYYYNATTYLSVRQQDSLYLTWFGPNFSNSTDRKEQSNSIRQENFRNYASRDLTEGYSHKYNLNDIRFWTSSEWDEIEKEKIKKKEFEEEKKKHPENFLNNSN